jgi:hypothetical protein
MRKSDDYHNDMSSELNVYDIDNVVIDDNGVAVERELTFSTGSYFTDSLLSMFLTIWFVFGNYWILSIYEPVYEQKLREPNNWCNKNLYDFALIHLLVYYALLLLTFVFFIILTIFTQIPYLIMKFQEC